MNRNKQDSFEDRLIENEKGGYQDERFNPYDQRQHSYPDLDDQPQVQPGQREQTSIDEFEAFDMDDPMKSSPT